MFLFSSTEKVDLNREQKKLSPSFYINKFVELDIPSIDLVDARVIQLFRSRYLHEIVFLFFLIDLNVRASDKSWSKVQQQQMMQ